MFAKDGGGGGAHMFAAALKMLGLQPEVIEKLSHGLLVDLKRVAGLQEENLARQEFILRCMKAPEGIDAPDAWSAYLAVRRAEHDRQLVAAGYNGSGGNANAGNNGAAG